MNSISEKLNPSNFKKPIFIAVGAVILILAVYLAYTMLSSRANPCESIFKQTAIRVQNNIESIKKKSSNLIDAAQIQKLSTDAQQAALSLKECCILFHEENVSFDEFLKCQDDFKNFEMALDRVTDLIGEIHQARQQEQTELLNYKLERIHQTLEGLSQSSRRLQARIRQYTGQSQGTAHRAGPTTTSAGAEVEPNDAYDQATPISLEKIGAELSPSQDADFFKFEVPSGSILNLDFTPDESGQPMKISLRNMERQEIWNADNVVPGVTKSTQIILNTTAGGTFFVVVSDGFGHYDLDLSAKSQNDAGSGNDAGDKITRAVEVRPGASYPGQLGGFDVEDWYQFEIPPGHILNLSFTPDPEAQAMNFSLRNFERDEIWYLDKATPGVTRSKRMILNTLSGGRYYLTVYDGRGLYTFEITAESQNDAGSGNDAGDKITRSIEIKPGRSFQGEFGGLDEEDWYQFQLSNGDILEFAFTPSPESKSMIFSLFNYERQEVWQSGEITPGVTKSDRLTMNSTSGGTYFLKAFYGGGVYQIDLHTKSQNDAGSGNDAGDKITRAIEINSGGTVLGELGGLDLEDWYTFDLKSGEKLSFTCDPDSESMKMALHTLDQRDIGYSADILPGVTKSFEIPENIKPPYFIRIFEGQGKYSIQLR
ncbi:MAG: hypothetical protein PVF56_20715 [Desulfobacterales bacterium]|jgi:hypothetical protein